PVSSLFPYTTLFRSRDFGLAAHHQRAERRNDLDKFALAQPSLDRNLQRVIAREFVHSALRNRIGNKNLWRSHSSLTFRRSIRSHKCHSERSEESHYFLKLVFRKWTGPEMFRFAQHDKCFYEWAHLNLKT